MAHSLTLVLVDAHAADVVAVARAAMRRYWADDLGDDPDARCDGFTVGGRFDGVLHGAAQEFNLSPQRFRERYGRDVVRPGDNVQLVARLPVELLPYAVIDAAGCWHDGAGVPQQQWRQRYRALLAAHPDHWAVGVDFDVGDQGGIPPAATRAIAATAGRKSDGSTSPSGHRCRTAPTAWSDNA